MSESEDTAIVLNAMLDRDVAEHLANGVTAAPDMLRVLRAMPQWREAGFTLAAIERYMRTMTRDTREIARNIVRARAAQTMLDVLEDGEPKDKIQVLAKWGPETNAEHIETKVDAVTRHVVELHEGPPPKV